MNKLFLVIIFLIFGIFANGQGSVYFRGGQYIFQNKVNVGSTTLAANPPDAWLTVGDSASTKAMIIPRVQSTAAVDTPRQGMIVYSISDSSFYYRTLYGWRKSANINTTNAIEASLLKISTSPVFEVVASDPLTGTNAIEVSTSEVRFGNVSPTGSALTRNAYIYGNSLYGVRFNNARFAQDTGTRVTAINDLTLGKDGNIFYISDTTRIKGIDTIGWQAGSIVHLFFLNYNKIMDSVVAGAGMAKIYLDGNEDSVIFQPGDYISFMYNGGVWNEIGRKSRKSLSGYNIYNKDSTFTSDRTASLNGKFFKLYDGTNNNFIVDPVEHQYFLGWQELQNYNYINLRDSVITVNAGNHILESHVTLTNDALNVKSVIDVNGTEMLKLENLTGEKATINSDSLYLTATASGASVGNVLKLINPGSGSAVWGSLNSLLGTQSKSAFWEFPAAADTIVMFTTTAAITITSIKTVCTGGSSASVTFQVYQGSDRSSGTAVLSGAATTTSITTVESDTGFNDATVPANTQIWIVITAGAGNGINFNINFTYD